MSEAKKTHALATSSGDPPLLSGIVSRQPCTVAGSSFSVISVSMNPGAIALQRMLLDPNSRATLLVKPRIPALEAE